METLSIDGTNGDGVDTIRVTVKITLIVDGTTVATGEDENATFTTSTFLNPVQHGLEDQSGWSFHTPTVIRWSPTTAVDMILLISIV